MDSKLDSLILSNSVPSHGEATHIRSLISDGIDDLSKLDIRIAQTRAVITQAQATLDELIAQRDRQSSRVELMQKVVSPLRFLTPELLADIFIYCVQSNIFIPGNILLPLCRVCRDWREIAIATPILWCSLSFPVTAANIEGCVELANACAERAGTRPLQIAMDGSGLPTQRILYNPITDIIAPYLRRWKRLQLILPAAVLQDLFDLPGGSLEILEAITIQASDVQSPTWETPATVFEEAPKLRRVYIHSNQMHSDPSVFRLPWSQLEDLTLNVLHTPQESFAVLSLCSNLVDCRLTIKWWSEDRFADRAVLPKLRSLELTTNQDLSNFLDCLTLPALDTFVLRSSSSNPVIWHPRAAFLPLIARSRCQLKSLTLRLLDLRQDGFVECLEAIPSLIELVIEAGSFVTNSILDQMTYKEESPGRLLVPALEVLRLMVVGPSVRDEVLETMITSRWWSDADTVNSRLISRLRIADIALRRGTRVDEDVSARLSELRNQGLDVLIRRYEEKRGEEFAVTQDPSLHLLETELLDFD